MELPSSHCHPAWELDGRVLLTTTRDEWAIVKTNNRTSVPAGKPSGGHRSKACVLNPKTLTVYLNLESHSEWARALPVSAHHRPCSSSETPQPTKKVAINILKKDQELCFAPCSAPTLHPNWGCAQSLPSSLSWPLQMSQATTGLRGLSFLLATPNSAGSLSVLPPEPGHPDSRFPTCSQTHANTQCQLFSCSFLTFA